MQKKGDQAKSRQNNEEGSPRELAWDAQFVKS
jgi:hypothetical protein